MVTIASLYSQLYQNPINLDIATFIKSIIYSLLTIGGENIPPSFMSAINKAFRNDLQHSNCNEDECDLHKHKYLSWP